MSAVDERFELGPEVADFGTSRIHAGSVRATHEPVFVQVLARSEQELAALHEALEKGARALSDAGVPGRPVQWDVTTPPGWIAYDQHGEPLAAAVRRGRDPSLVDAVAVETAVALEILGKVGLAHRAINPRTLFHQNRRIAVLGLDALRASYAAARGDSVPPNDPRFTAPEAFDGGGDIKADVYSLGCVLFALMTGTPPYFGAAQDLREAHRSQPIPTVPGNDALGWNDLLRRMLAKDPGSRPQPGDIAALVRKARQRSSVALPAAPVVVPLKRRSGRGPLVFALGAALVLMLLGGFAVSTVLAPSSPSTPGTPAASAGPVSSAPVGVASPTAAPSVAATPEPTAQATAAPTPPSVIRTAPPRTPAPTAPPPPPPQQAQAAVTPTVGQGGTIFLFTFTDMPPAVPFTGQYTTPQGENFIHERGAVPLDGIIRLSLGTNRGYAKGGYAYRVTAGSITRAIIFTIN